MSIEEYAELLFAVAEIGVQNQWLRATCAASMTSAGIMLQRRLLELQLKAELIERKKQDIISRRREAQAKVDAFLAKRAAGRR